MICFCRLIRFLVLPSFGLLLAMPVCATANLIENGSFETPDISKVIGKRGGTSSTWQYYDSSLVDGFSGSNIEIWNSGFLGVNAMHGNQFIELNSHPTSRNQPFSIFQEFDTTVGQSYDVSFYYEARTKRKEAFNVSFDSASSGASLLDSNLNDHRRGGLWSLFTGMFTAKENKTRMSFTSITPKTRTLGNFIDNVRVTAAVPEINAGSTGLALGLLLSVMSIMRERRKR